MGEMYFSKMQTVFKHMVQNNKLNTCSKLTCTNTTISILPNPVTNNNKIIQEKVHFAHAFNNLKLFRRRKKLGGGGMIRIKELIFYSKNCFQAFGNMNRDVHPGSGS
jgi:hypothetical protein